MEKIDAVVIGAGVIGLAVARALSLAGREVVIAESEKLIGSITSARNSGVIHAGIYYPQGSNKALHCVRGKDMLYRYATERAIPFRNCGKLIVAVTPDDIPKLQSIKEKARLNGAGDLRELSRKDAEGIEPELACLAALSSPTTGIIDVHALLENILSDVENAGGILALQNNVQSGEVTDEGIILHLESGSILARTVINAAGLGAQSIAQKIVGLSPETIPQQHLAKGNYFSISGAAPFSQLIYPVPVNGGLGAHFTMNMSGESLFGPDVEWLRPQHYSNINYDVDPNRMERFKESVKRYWPGIESRPLNPAYSGVRPKLSMQGAADGDFIIQTVHDHGVPGLINLYGIESPGITSALSIAETIGKFANA